MKYVEMVIIGGGSAGMSAALQARADGIEDILILERSEELGGILQQCIHNGFGLQIFQEELSGPMYAQRFCERVEKESIAYKVNTTVVEITKDRKVLYVNQEEGYVLLQAGVILLACGCYERNRGAIQICGKRLPGVYTAGSAQRFLNLENILVGKRIFILGSGDIGLIMARRMTLEGAKVLGVAEIMPYSNGLTRNIVQCLQDFDIPLYVSHTVIDIQGKNHVEQVTIAKVDDQQNVIAGSEKTFAVDTLLLSIGLIPENELSYQAGIGLHPKTKGAVVNEYFETDVKGIYACGNALHVHDIVDYVTLEAQEAAHAAACDIRQHIEHTRDIPVKNGAGVSYVLPHVIEKSAKKDITFCMRVTKPFTACEIVIKDEKRDILRLKKRYLLPAEMQRIKVRSDRMDAIAESITFEVNAL